MRHQLSLPGLETYPTEILCQGIITPDGYIREGLREKYAEIMRTDSASLTEEYERMSRILGKEPVPDICDEVRSVIFGEETDIGDSADDANVGRLTLLPSSSREYYPDDFRPHEWVHDSEIVQDRRRIYTFTAEKRDGSYQKVMVKGPKMNMWIGRGNGLLSISEIYPQKTSEEESELLVYLQSRCVPVEPPIGYFAHGKEHWLFTEFVDGRVPLELLAGEGTRQDVWRADARLLARLCNADVKHWGFYSQEFDDKLWVDGELVLIDTDESFRMLKGFHNKGMKKSQLPAYKDAWVIDCLESYLRFKLIREDEVQDYMSTFLIEREGNDSRAGELLPKIDLDSMTEEGYICMMMDSD